MDNKSLCDVIKMVNEQPETVSKALNQSPAITNQDYAERLFRWLSSNCTPERAKHIAKVIQFNDSPLFGAKKKKAQLISHILILNTALIIHTANKICDPNKVKPIVDEFLKLAFKYCFKPVESINKNLQKEYEEGLSNYFDYLKLNSSILDLSGYFTHQLKIKNDIEVAETYMAAIIGSNTRELEGFLLIWTGIYHYLKTSNSNRIFSGSFFDIIVLRFAIDKSYPDGSFGLARDLGIKGSINNDFLVWGTMSSDNTIDAVINKLKEAGLNCDNDDINCVYACTQLGMPPEKERYWLDHKVINQAKCEMWLKD